MQPINDGIFLLPSMLNFATLRPRHACSFKWDEAARMQLISKPVQSFTLRTPVHLPRSPVLAMAPLWISPTETASCTAGGKDLPGLMGVWQQWSDASERVEG